MVQVADQFHHVKFSGAKVAVGLLERKVRRVRHAPSPSIFAAPFPPPAPFIPPTDGLLLADVFRRLQINVGSYRPAALGRRVSACLRAMQVRSPAEAQRRLKQNDGALDLAANALLIGVTAFFRDEPAFSHLSRAVLPDFVRTSPEPRVLSVGCSDGAEAYSLAIALTEAGARDFSICGIDCRGRAIERARAGVYPASWLENIPQDLRGRYFDGEDQSYRVKAEVRARVKFYLGDAFVHVLTPPYDFIACRNFAIYLEHPAAARLWRRLHAALRPGGYLFTGKAERPTAGFLRAGPCLFRKALP